MFFEVARDQIVDMKRSSRAFRDGVGSIGIVHKIKALSELDQAVDQ